MLASTSLVNVTSAQNLAADATMFRLALVADVAMATAFLFPDLPAVVHTILTAPTFAEFWVVAYLLIKGVRTPAAGQLRPLAERA